MANCNCYRCTNSCAPTNCQNECVCTNPSYTSLGCVDVQSECIIYNGDNMPSIGVVRNQNLNSNLIGINDAILDLQNTSPIGYQAYTALLTQERIYQYLGPLEIGRTYVIDDLLGDDDFTNVGFVALDIPFVATGTTPTDWTEETTVIDYLFSVPSAIIINESASNYIGEIIWSRVTSGIYEGKKTGAFPSRIKTFIMANGFSSIVNGEWIDEDTIRINVQRVTDGGLFDDLLNNSPIDIRVYS